MRVCSDRWQWTTGLVLTCLLAAGAASTLAAAAYAVSRPDAIDYGEPVVYGHALRMVLGEPIYKPIDQAPFSIAAYTPLYYWLGAALIELLGPGFGPGRALSALAGVLTTVVVGTLASRGFRRPWWVGPFTGVLFLAFGFPRPDTPWLGLYRVDMVGIALSALAILVLTSRRSTHADVIAGVLCGLALLCKQNLFAALITGTLWRWPAINRTFAATAVITLALPCVVLESTTGAFVQNTVVANANPF